MIICDLIWENQKYCTKNFKRMVVYMPLLHSHFVKDAYQIQYPQEIIIKVIGR